MLLDYCIYFIGFFHLIVTFIIIWFIGIIFFIIIFIFLIIMGSCIAFLICMPSFICFIFFIVNIISTFTWIKTTLSLIFWLRKRIIIIRLIFFFFWNVLMRIIYSSILSCMLGKRYFFLDIGLFIYISYFFYLYLCFELAEYMNYKESFWYLLDSNNFYYCLNMQKLKNHNLSLFFGTDYISNYFY